MSIDLDNLEAEADKELADAYGIEPTTDSATESQESSDTADIEQTPETVSEPVEEQHEAVVSEQQYKDAVRGMNKAQQEAAQLRKELAALQAQIQQQPEPKQEPASDMDDMSLSEFQQEYPELYNDLAAPLLKQIEALKQHVAKFDGVAQQFQQEKAATAQQSHEQAILSAHPDAFELVEKPEFQAWASQQGPFVRYALSQGTAQEVVDALNLYRQANPGQQRQPRADKLEEARAAATPSVKSSQSEPQKTKFTLAEIEKMSRDEFLKHEAAIDAAIARGELVY